MSKVRGVSRLFGFMVAMALATLVSSGAVAQVEKAPVPVPRPPLEMVSPPLHLGYHRPGELAQGVMTFLNTGEETLTIKQVKSSCDCTLAEAGKKIIKPGETVDVFVGMNISDSLGAVTRDIGIIVEGYEPPVPATVSVEIGYPVRFNKGGRTVGVSGIRGSFTVDSVEGRAFRVLAVNGRTPQFIGFDPKSDELRSNYELFFDWSDIPAESRPRWLVLETDHPGAEMIEMPAQIQGVPRLNDAKSGWNSIQRRLVLGTIDAGMPKETIVSLGAVPIQGGKPLRVTARDPKLGVRIITVRPSTTHGAAVDVVMQLIPSSSMEGFLSTVVDFETEGHACGVDVFARVVDPAKRGG